MSATRPWLWSRWADATARREPANAVAVVRIVIGLSIVAHLLRLLWTETWRWVWLPPVHGGLVPLNSGPLDWVGGATPPLVLGVIVATLVSSAALAIGVLTPGAAVVTALGWAVLVGLGPNAGGSYDFLGANILFLLIFAGSGRAWSLDAWWRARRGPAPLDAPVWPRWLMVWQLVVMYDTTAWQKVSSSWVLGGPADALWYILQQPTWHRFEMAWLAPLYPLTQVMTVSTWLWEHASPIILIAAWFRATRGRAGWFRAQCNRVDARLPYLAFGVLMHLSIEATLDVGCFSSFTFALYAACFSGDEWSNISRARRTKGPPHVKPATVTAPTLQSRVR